MSLAEVLGIATAADAMHSLCRAAPVDVFPFPDRQEEVDMLASWWGISTPSQLRDQLLRLLPAPRYLILDNTRAVALPAGVAFSGGWRTRLENEITGRANPAR